MISAVLERCAGIDVHKKFVTVCVMSGAAQEAPQVKKARYRTLNGDLEQLRQWLHQLDCRDVVMESTGCYWKPVANILEDGWIRMTLANASQVKNLRGHKTDMKDCEWLAHLHRHGMIRASYIPDKPIRELRDLTRRRKQLVRNSADERNRIQKWLEECNIKLGSVLSDIFGASGLAMLIALIGGEAAVDKIAALAKGTARKKMAEIQASLQGHRMSQNQRLLIEQALQHLAFLEQQIQEVDGRIREKINTSGFRPVYERLQTIGGIKEEAAAVVLAEVGADVQAFASEEKLSSWAGVCPGNNESAGKRQSGRTTKGNPYLRDMLLEAAWASTRKKNSSLQKFYNHLKPRKGYKRAIVAVAHRLVRAIYWVLGTGQNWVDRCLPALTMEKAAKLVRHHSRRLSHLKTMLEAMGIWQFNPPAPRGNLSTT